MDENYYIQRVNRAIDYIEANYHTKISTLDLADVSAFSEYHFHRIFKLVTGETVNQYIKRLKMGKAKRNLVLDNKSITDIAFDFGYKSSANFARDFKQYYNQSASSVRNQGINKNALIPNSDLNMEYIGIRDLEERTLMYKRVPTGYDTVHIQKAFQELLGFIHKNNISYRDVTSIGIGYDDPDYIEPQKCRYDACIHLKKDMGLDIGDFNSRVFDPGKCAVYIFEGKADDFAIAWDYIFKTWISSDKYTLGNSPHFEEYLVSEKYDQGYFKAKLCLPIILKS